MKILSNQWLLMVSFILIAISIDAQKLKPYTIGAVAEGSIVEVAQKVETELAKQGIKILGSYHPIESPDRMVIGITSDDLIKAIEMTGGLTGFAAAWKVALTEEDGKIIISYNTPEYWGNAYFQKKFSKVENLYTNYNTAISTALANCGEGSGEVYGSEDGLEAKRLQNYRYKVLMPQFDDTKELAKFGSYQEAVNSIDNHFASGISDLTKVYEVVVPDQEIKLYGIGLSGKDGEGKFMPKIDIANPKHTAFLPYEILVLENKVHMLHGRYRIALSFPDLSMGQFMKIVSTPGDIEDLMEKACKGEEN